MHKEWNQETSGESFATITQTTRGLDVLAISLKTGEMDIKILSFKTRGIDILTLPLKTGEMDIRILSFRTREIDVLALSLKTGEIDTKTRGLDILLAGSR